MELVGFLLARIAEDEAEARRAIETLKDPALLGRLIPGWSTWPRRLVECQTKRRIVTEVYPALERDSESLNYEFGAAEADPEIVLRLLALPYADHPDYQQEWRP